MIRTVFYDPAEPDEFRRNMKRRWNMYSDRVEYYNSEQSMAKRSNGELIYHVLDATVFIRRSSEDHMVGITANVTRIEDDEIVKVKSLSEKNIKN